MDAKSDGTDDRCQSGGTWEPVSDEALQLYYLHNSSGMSLLNPCFIMAAIITALHYWPMQMGYEIWMMVVWVERSTWDLCSLQKREEELQSSNLWLVSSGWRRAKQLSSLLSPRLPANVTPSLSLLCLVHPLLFLFLCHLFFCFYPSISFLFILAWQAGQFLPQWGGKSQREWTGSCWYRVNVIIPVQELWFKVSASKAVLIRYSFMCEDFIIFHLAEELRGQGIKFKPSWAPWYVWE